MLLEGIFPAVTTPFFADGRLYLPKLEHNMARYGRTPASGLVVLGSTGEAVMLSDDESREVLRTAVQAVSADKVLLAGVGRESVAGTLSVAEFAAREGYDAALVRTPSYYGPQLTPMAMLTYFRTVADRSPLPVVLYSIPKFTHYSIPNEVVAELAAHPNIIGLKDSSGDVSRLASLVAVTRSAPKRQVQVTSVFAAVTRRMQAVDEPGDSGLVSLQTGSGGVAAPPALRAKTRTKEVGFQVLSGSADKLHASLAAGATGAVLALAGFAPQACHEVYVAWKEKDEPLAEEKQQRLVEPSNHVVGALGIAGIKYALDVNGYFGGRARLPLLPLTREQQADVERSIADLRT